MTIDEFLLARWAEDEAVALAVRDVHDPLPWDQDDDTDPAWHMAGPCDSPSGYLVVVVDPARVLLEVAAKRAIRVAVRSSPPTLELESGVPYVLALLALPYAGHPDYDKSWDPDMP